MKKFIVTIVCLAYFAVSSGVIINLHYCMNKLASTGLFASATKKCGKCGMDIHKSDGCCRDEVQLLKIEDDQKTTAALTFDLPAIEAMVMKPSDFIAASFYTIPGKKHFLNHSPPLLSSQDSYLQNSVFRIWEMNGEWWKMNFNHRGNIASDGSWNFCNHHFNYRVQFSNSQFSNQQSWKRLKYSPSFYSPWQLPGAH